MKKIAWLVSHEPTQDQRKEAFERWGAELVSPPEEVLSVWGNIPAGSLTPDELDKHLEPVYDWLKPFVKAKGLAEDFSAMIPRAIMQGEISACWSIGLELNGILCYWAVATTERKVIEEKLPDGSVKKTAIFNHAGFRVCTVCEELVMARMRAITNEVKE